MNSWNMRVSSPSPPCPHILDVLSRSAKHKESQKQQLDGHIKDLSKSLSFSDEVFSKTYPSRPTDTYVSAKHHKRDLFTSKSMPVQMHEPKRSALSGRHNPRGSGSKHLPCCLDSSAKGVTVDASPQLREEEQRSMPYIKGHIESVSRSKVEVGAYNVNDSRYANALLGGAKPLYPSDNTIWLDDGSRYRKTLQPMFPQPPGSYVSEKSKETWETREKGKMGYVRGGQRPGRWLDLPHLTKSSKHEWVLRSGSETPSRLPQQQDNMPVLKIRPTEGQELFEIIKEWATQRKLHLQLKDVQSPGVLVKDMLSLSNRVKMMAVLSVVLLAEHQASRQTETSQHLHQPTMGDISVQGRELVPEELAISLEKLLEETEAIHVRVPSAIALHAIKRNSDKAQSVLMCALQEKSEGLAEEAWAAVQCLVYAGCHSAAIIASLLQYLFNDHSPSKQAKAGDLMVKVSLKTSLVFHMLVDRLNTSGWKERLITCRTLSRLHGNMSKDLCSKLLVCVWEDWSPEVRQAAAQALGHTGHGKLIHDEISARLMNASEMVRLDAIRKLHSLRFMTSRLLPGYLACFTDEHLSIQSEALALAGSIKLHHPLVFKAIKQLLQESRVWTIKMCALRALGQIGKCDQVLVQHLVWMVRFEKLPAVRAEACRTIAQLGLTETLVVDSLKSLITVEDDPVVVQAAKRTLEELGQSQGVRDEMLETVCRTVRELGTKEAITNTILDTGTQELANYVLEDRPLKPITGRDYLDHKYRSKVYGDGVPSRTGSHLSTKNSPRWGPDRKFIDSKLAAIRTKLQLIKS